jgi:hypothetical protein
MKCYIDAESVIKTTVLVVLSFLFLECSSQNAVKSTPLGIGKDCGTSKDSFRLMSYDDPTNKLTISYACKPNLGGGTPSGPPFSSSAGSVAFNPKDQKVYYIATTTGNESFVYSWVPNVCPSVKKVYDYYYPSQFVVGLDFDPNTTNGDGYQLEFTGAAAPYSLWLRKVNFASNYFGPSVQMTMPTGKKIYQQRGDIIFTPLGQLYFAFDDKLFDVNYSNYSAGSVSANYIDTLSLPSGYHLTGISYVNGKFIGSIQNSVTGCAFKEIDVSNGSAIITNVTTTSNFTALDMATMISGIGLAKKVYSVTPSGTNQWTVQYDVKVKNFGNTILNNVQLVENLSAVYGSIVSNVTVSAVGTLPGGLILNSSFNGTTNTNILVGGATSKLNTSPADSATLRISFVLTNPILSKTYFSSTLGSAKDNLFGTSVSDSSNNDLGLAADLSGNGVPDDANEDTPTPLTMSEWTVLSNTISDFNGKYLDKKVNLQWTLANTEIGLTANIQRSSDGRSYQALTTLPAKASDSQVTYAWTDEAPYVDDNFYRLEFKRKDHTSFFSDVLAISPKISTANAMTVSPNPFNDHIYFTVSLDKAQKIQYRLIGMDSKLIVSVETQGQTGNNAYSIDRLSNLPPGTYLLQTITDGKTFDKVIIKTP